VDLLEERLVRRGEVLAPLPRPAGAAVQARISGRGWVHGIHQIGLDPYDPYPEGYLLSDCWGEAFDLLG